MQQIEHDDHEIAVETSCHPWPPFQIVLLSFMRLFARSDQPSTRRPSSSWADMLDDDGDDEDRALIPVPNCTMNIHLSRCLAPREFPR